MVVEFRIVPSSFLSSPRSPRLFFSAGKSVARAARLFSFGSVRKRVDEVGYVKVFPFSTGPARDQSVLYNSLLIFPLLPQKPGLYMLAHNPKLTEMGTFVPFSRPSRKESSWVLYEFPSPRILTSPKASIDTAF